jgi:hypothetical protein
MDTFYCVGCRSDYPIEKSARLTPGVHRDGAAVGFCFLCARDVYRAEDSVVPEAVLEEEVVSA